MISESSSPQNSLYTTFFNNKHEVSLLLIQERVFTVPKYYETVIKMGAKLQRSKNGTNNQYIYEGADLNVTKEQEDFLYNQLTLQDIQTTQQGFNLMELCSSLGLLELVQHFITNIGYNVNEGTQPILSCACWCGHIELVKYILSIEGVNINILSADKSLKANAFYSACQKGHIEIIKILLNRPDLDINIPDSRGHQPIYIASQEGHYEAVKLILEDPRCKLDPTTGFRFSPFSAACFYNWPKIVQLFLDDGRLDPMLYENQSCLHVATYYTKIETIQTLLDSPRVIPSISAFVKAFGTPQSTEVVKCYLKRKEIPPQSYFLEAIKHRDTSVILYMVSKDYSPPENIKCTMGYKDAVALICSQSVIKLDQLVHNSLLSQTPSPNPLSTYLEDHNKGRRWARKIHNFSGKFF